MRKTAPPILRISGRLVLPLLAVGGVMLVFSPSATPSATSATADARTATAQPGPRIGGPFRSTTHRGQPFSEKDLAGAPYAIFFGFTYCPDVCPTTLWEMSQDLEELGADGDRIRVVFASVDPERDTPATLGDYLGSFDERIIGLTGTLEQTADLARAYKATYRKVLTGDEPDDYTVEHSSIVYLMDADGRLFDTIRYLEDRESRLAKLRALAGSGSASAGGAERTRP